MLGRRGGRWPNVKPALVLAPRVCWDVAQLDQCRACVSNVGPEWSPHWSCRDTEKNTLTQCWVNVGPPSTTMAQHWPNIGWVSLVSRVDARRRSVQGIPVHRVTRASLDPGASVPAGCDAVLGEGRGGGSDTPAIPAHSLAAFWRQVCECNVNKWESEKNCI